MVPLPKHRISAGSLHTSITQGRVATDSLALLPPLPFSFPPSRLLAPTELCARCLGPLMRHLDNSGFIRDRKVSKKSERWFGDRSGRDGPQCETLPAAIRYPGRFLALAADPTRLCANASRGKRDLLRRGRRHHCAW